MTSVLVTPKTTGEGRHTTPSTKTSGSSSPPSYERDKPATTPTAPRAGVLAAALAALCLAELLVVMDNTIVNVAIPAMRSDLGATPAQMQWVVDIYTLVLASLLILAGFFVLTEEFGFESILGAFGAGMVVSDTTDLYTVGEMIDV